MAADSKNEDVKKLRQQVKLLESELANKNQEILIYRQELIKFSQRLDGLMSQLTSDTNLVSQIYRVLVPTEIPKFPGFEISRKFTYGSKSGGDYFDLFEHEDKMKFGLLVASSSGYAMSALFLSFVLKVSHILEAKRGEASHMIMQKIADDLKQSAGPQDFTHAFYGVVDRRNYQLEFCSVGDILGFYQVQGKAPLVLKSPSAGFGKDFNSKLTSMTLELEPRSRLCVVTNGLSDILGLDRIVKILSESYQKDVHDLRNELLFAAQQITKKETPDRDQTVVVLEVKDKVIKLAK